MKRNFNGRESGDSLSGEVLPEFHSLIVIQTIYSTAQQHPA
jgi:hypothetical protein